MYNRRAGSTRESAMVQSSPPTTPIHEDRDAPFAPRRFAHVNLYVSDLERSLGFYRDICGLTPVFEEPGIEAWFLSNGNTHHDIALMQASSGELRGRDGHVQKTSVRGAEPGLNHLAFEMESEASLVAGLGSAALRGIEPARLLDHIISRSAYLADPDGIVLKFYADSTRQWRETYEFHASELITSQWQPDVESASTEPRYEPEPTLSPFPSALVPVMRASRAAIEVTDLERSLDYYLHVVGLQVLRDCPEARTAVLGGTLGLPDLLLIETGRGRLHHIGFEVASEQILQAARPRLEAARIDVVHHIDRYDLSALVIADPDGNLVELFRQRESSKDADGSQAADQVSGIDRMFTI